jgi:hypothetical protein
MNPIRSASPSRQRHPQWGHRLFLLLFTLFSLSLFCYRLAWIHSARRTTAEVVSIETTPQVLLPQDYPLVRYFVDGRPIVTAGTYNMPFRVGEIIPIRYLPRDPRHFRVDTAYWLWLDIWSWYLPLLVMILLYFTVYALARRELRQRLQLAETIKAALAAKREEEEGE